MNPASVPQQLPLAPRPLRNELLSSWLLRTAAANAISFSELLHGLQMRYPVTILPNQILDYSVPEPILRALSHFTRVPLTRLASLDLDVRVPDLNPALLLYFHGKEFSIGFPRGRKWRVRYAFCPKCISLQKILHIRWDWCFAALIRCAVHRFALLDACPGCGAVDPLNFSLPSLPPSLLCRWCYADMTSYSKPNYLPDDDIVSVIETAYRSALLGLAPHTKLLDNATDRAFRQFIEDMLELLLVTLCYHAEWHDAFGSLLIPRQSLLTMIADLVENATPASDPNDRGARYRRSIRLWSALFEVISERQGKELEGCSRHWPLSLRRRFNTALEHRSRKRRPYNPYPHHRPGIKFKYNTLADVFDLSAASVSQSRQSQI